MFPLPMRWGKAENNLSHINLAIQDGETVLLCGEVWLANTNPADQQFDHITTVKLTEQSS